MDAKTVDWLLEGDVSLQYQVRRDLLGEEEPGLQARVASEGWGAAFLVRQNPDGSWGRGFYQPKWISSHYTLLDLKTLELPRRHPAALRAVRLIAEHNKGADGGINPSKTIKESDVCVNGMFLNYACYFGLDESALHSVIDFTLEQRLPDGGFNCCYNRIGANHSSMHSTISVIEGIEEYDRSGYLYRLDDVRRAAAAGREFLLQHQIFRSDRTGDVIRRDFLRLSFPGRWRYDILRALDHFERAGAAWDERMGPAVELLLSKRRKDGRWPLQTHIPGQVHFHMEEAGQPSRWNTLRALRVLRRYPR